MYSGQEAQDSLGVRWGDTSPDGEAGRRRAQTSFTEERASKVDPRGGAEGLRRVGKRARQREEPPERPGAHFPHETRLVAPWGWSRKREQARGDMG